MTEMTKRFPQEQQHEMTRCFQDRSMGLEEPSNSSKIVKLVLLRKPDAEPKKEISSYRAIALASVMSTWYATCIILRLE